MADHGHTPPMSHPYHPDHFSRRTPDGDNRERLVCDSCGFVSYENPKVVVGSVCTWGDRILLCKRAIQPRRGFWTLPAGYLEVREATTDGAAREAYEEALAHIEIDALLAVYNIPRISQVQVIYRARLVSPTSPPGRRARRSACSPGTRSPGTISRSPACAGRSATSARWRDARVHRPHEPAGRARRILETKDEGRKTKDEGQKVTKDDKTA
jgi:ADP-ribose pyrophosphatase YjhB (NUDIX family)